MLVPPLGRGLVEQWHDEGASCHPVTTMSSLTSTPDMSIEHIEAPTARIAPPVRRTPVITAPSLDTMVDATVVFS